MDIWHFGVHERAEAVKAMITGRRFGFPEEWYSHILANSQAVTAEDLEGQPEFLEKIEMQNAGLSFVLAAPVVVGGEIAAVCQYFSDEPMNRGQLFLDIMANIKARLGQIIEQKQADENVRSLSTRLFHVQDEERRQLARELHDTTAQNVAAILMDLGVISRNANALPDAANQALSESLALARQSLQEIRSFSYLIHPPMLEELGLIAALRIFIEGFSQRSGMHVRLEAPDSCPKLATRLETTVFRVVQEGLTNARRHSGSSTADVRLKGEFSGIETERGKRDYGWFIVGPTRGPSNRPSSESACAACRSACNISGDISAFILERIEPFWKSFSPSRRRQGKREILSRLRIPMLEGLRWKSEPDRATRPARSERLSEIA